MQRTPFLLLAFVFIGSLKAVSQQRLPQAADTARGVPSLKILPQNFYKQSLPFSCRSELQLQKLTALPLYFRLGSKDYVDYLEKKPNAAKQP